MKINELNKVNEVNGVNRVNGVNGLNGLNGLNKFQTCNTKLVLLLFTYPYPLYQAFDPAFEAFPLAS